MTPEQVVLCTHRRCKQEAVEGTKFCEDHQPDRTDVTDELIAAASQLSAAEMLRRAMAAGYVTASSGGAFVYA